ncbi:MAG: methylmalonyl Co-A mutase-associated GTPase MeaB [Edaphocola sp.]
MAKKTFDIDVLQKELLGGNIAALSKAITLIESTRADHQHTAAALVNNLLPHAGKSVRIGITGVPGVGKSTFIEAFGMQLIKSGKKVAVLAIDPSSSISKGSILGDKTRMEQLSVAKEAFIRPSAAAGSLGGITYKTKEAAMLCEAAGFDTIIIETVGVGQSETEVGQITDFFLLLMLAGAGDELQGIKRGIMEMADALVITKADGDNLQKAKTARSEYARALHFLPPKANDWHPEVKICSGIDNSGIADIIAMIDKFVVHQQLNGYFWEARKKQELYAFHKMINEQLRLLLLHRPGILEAIGDLEGELSRGKLTAYTAVNKLTALLRQ